MEETSKRGDLSNHTSCSVNEEKSASERERGKKRKGSHESDEVPKRSRSGAQAGLSSEKGREKATSSATTETKLTERYGSYVRMHSPWVPEDNKRKGTPSALPDGPRSGVEPVPTDDVPDGVEKPLSGLPGANLRKPKR
ncbi:uncharacterized protein LOC128219311 [Mya arenaria]|uniref:uncharacterized protein LOC128219311 n=1 Tax=Mya arenaria TaxID=6604 RepID=UPI0022E36209|nr:uncharacterized protein LOC128219311 [Mya arenaria]